MFHIMMANEDHWSTHQCHFSMCLSWSKKLARNVLKLMHFLLSISNNIKQLWSNLHQVHSCLHCDTNQQRWLTSPSSEFTHGLSVMVEHHSGYQYWLTARYVMLPVDATTLYNCTKYTEMQRSLATILAKNRPGKQACW